MVYMVFVYDLNKVYVDNLLVWLFYVDCVYLEGLLFYVILVNELDFLCDEGMVYYCKFLGVGV